MPAPQKRPKGGCDALSQHMRAISRISLLTADEEISLARLVQCGCRATDVSEEMKLRAGGVKPSLEAWALEIGTDAPVAAVPEAGAPGPPLPTHPRRVGGSDPGGHDWPDPRRRTV